MEKTIFKVIIAGSRTFNDYELLKMTLDRLLSEQKKAKQIVIISGTANGADLLGERYAAESKYQCIRYPANWRLFKGNAGMVRNSQMAQDADAAVVFWDGTSSGSRNMIEQMQEKEKPVRVIKYKKE